MKLILYTLISLSTLKMNAQDGSWTIRLNNKKLIETRKEDENKNRKLLKSTDWNKNGKIEISYKEDQPNTWIRTFLFFDEKDNEIYKTDSTIRFSISMDTIKTLYKGRKSINIYTVISPIDPNIAIRVRRVHLYSFILPEYAP